MAGDDKPRHIGMTNRIRDVKLGTFCIQDGEEYGEKTNGA